MCRSKAEGGRRCPTSTGKSKTTTAELDLAVVEAGTKKPADSQGELNPASPSFNQLLTTSPEEWWNLPWSERKVVAEKALHEVLSLTNSTATFGKWNSRKTSLGITISYYNRLTGENFTEVELSEPLLRVKEPRSVAETVAHEVAHTLSDLHAGHGTEWKERFEEVKSQFGLNIPTRSAHTASELEVEQELRLRAEKRANAPWKGECPQGHPFTAGRKPKWGHICVKCKSDGKPATITYERNTNRSRR